MKLKLKIMKTRPDISDEEIRGLMDFDKVLSDHAAARSTRNMFRWFGVVAVIGVLSWVGVSMSQTNVSTPLNETPVGTDTASQTTNKNTDENTQPGSPNSDETSPANDSLRASAAPLRNLREVKKESSATEKQTTSDLALPVVYTEAEPINGYPHLYEYFNTALKYPVEAAADSIQGTVSVSFIINSEGRPQNIRIDNSLGMSFDREAIRLIESMPSWKPATMNGKPVSAKLSVPLTFQIKPTQP